MPATCPNCGREIGRRDKFCDACGAFLGWDAGESADSQLFPQQAPQEDDQRANVRIEIRNDLIEVAPGNAESTAFTIKNLGTQVERFGFSLTGPDWLVVEPATVVVYPGDEATGTVQAAPPRKPGSVAGVTPFRLTVTSALHAHVSSSVAGRVDVAPYYELAAELIPTSSNGRGWTHHHIALENRGNVLLRIPLNPTDVADGLRLSVPAVADVAPGEVTEVPIAVHGPRRWFGRPEPKTFSIIAEAPKPLAPTRLSGTRIVAPLFPRWVPAAAAGLLAAGVATAVIATKLINNGPPLPPPTSSSAAGQSTAASSAASSAGSSSSVSQASSSFASTSASTSSSPVTVPDVTGETLQHADADISSKNLKPQPRAFWAGASAIASNVVRTDPTAGASVSSGSIVTVYVPIGTDGLIPASQTAQWTATSAFQPPAIVLSFGGKETDNTGAALLTGTVTLESGVVVTQALEAHPPPLTGGYIKGVYTLSPATIGAEQFRADIGFRQGTGGMISYQVVATEENGAQQEVAKGTHGAGTQLTPVIGDLPAGTAQVTLVVTALDSAPANDDVIWVNPRIEEANAPAEGIQPTPSASQISSVPPTP
jgi:PASTA domain